MSLDILVGFVLVLGVLILVHEWGHFIVARLFGVRVDVFSIGFGPRLFGFKWGATDWRISAVPLGGYVRMAGQDIIDVDSGDKPPTGAPDELMSKKRWQRALISAAGPAVNLIFPLFLLTGYFAIKGNPYPKYEDKPLVIADSLKESPLAKEGVVKGDRITSLNGISNPTWGTLNTVLGNAAPGASFQVTVEHEGQSRNLTVSTAGMQRPGLLFGQAPNVPLVADADKSRPAYKGGIRRDDLIDSINGKKVENWPGMVDAIQQSEGKPLSITVLRKGQPMTFQVTPELGKNELGNQVYLIGIAPGDDTAFRKVGFGESVSAAASTTYLFGERVLDVVGKLFTGKIAVKQLQSVVGIASEAGHAVQEGAFAVVMLMAALSINLGILNLLPIPILDGGHILLLTMEGIRRKDFSLAFKERFIQAGLVFLLVLFAYVMYNDIMRQFPHS